jgi:hypothetical protein
MLIVSFQAGLFSAIVTAFIIDSYKWLLPDPADATVQLLSQIAGQLGGAFNQTASHIRDPIVFRPSTRDVAINTLWFSSLVCSLVAALLCILAKQWIREYMRSVPISFREDISLRQFRYDGLKNWGVKGIIIFLPILLEAALALFLVGLIGLLWTLHVVMAAVVSGLVATALLFYLVTLILPAFSAVDCAFRTPTSWTLRRLWRWRMWHRPTYTVDSHRSWQDLDMDAAFKSHKPAAGLLWLTKVSQNRQVFSAVTDCVISDSGTDLFTDLEFLEGVMAHTAGCSVEVLQSTVKCLTSLTTLVDRDLEDQAIRDFRQQVPPHRLACLRRVALKRLMRIWNTTIPVMKAPLLDYMLTMLLIFNNSDGGGEDVIVVERNRVETIAFLSSFIRSLFDEAEKSAQDRTAYGWLPAQGQHIRGDQQVLCAKADNLLRHEIRSKLSSQEALQGSFVLSSPSQDSQSQPAVIPHLVSVARCAYTRMNVMFVDLSTSVFRFLVQNGVRKFEDPVLKEHFTFLIEDMLHFVEGFHETSGVRESGDSALMMRWVITLQHKTLAARLEDEEIVSLLSRLAEVLRGVRHMGLFPAASSIQERYS